VAPFLLSLREGLEAALVIGILLGAVRRLQPGDPRPARAIWLGSAAAAIVCVLLAVVLNSLSADLTGTAQAAFEGVTLLLAAGLLTWMIFWMQGQGKRMSTQLSGEVRRAVAGESRAPVASLSALTSIAFLAVLREGVELALFLAAAAFATGGGATIAGALLGLAAAAGLGGLLFAGTLRLSIGRFFQVTSVLLILFAAGMAAYGVHELVEGGLLPGIVTPLWNTDGLLSEHSPAGQFLEALFGYHSDPSLAEVTTYILYYAVVGVALLIRWERRQRAASPAAR
jgi:high-affinity iron transporter